MATSKEYIAFLQEQLSALGEVAFRPMMGEYLVYYRGKLIGDVCDDRLLVKPVGAAKQRLPDARLEAPYPGAQEMILVDEVDNAEVLCSLFHAMYAELPEPKPKKKK